MPAVHGFRDDEDRLEHFQKHRDEFPSIASAHEYELLAVDFLTMDKSATMLECIRANGDNVRFDTVTQLYAVCTKDGYIRTCFIPSPDPDVCLRYFEENC